MFLSSPSITILTGTSSGIGEEVARQLLRNNWNVIGLSRRSVDFGDERYRHVCVDLRDVEGLREVGERELGPVVRDGGWRRIGLVNNVGVVGGMGALEMDVGEVAGVFGVNVVAPMYLMGLVVREAPAGAGIRIA